MGFEIVKTGPEGDGKQPYFLRLQADNNEKIVHSERYAQRASAENAYIVISKQFLVYAPGEGEVYVYWNEDETKGYLTVGNWQVSHVPVTFVEEPAEQPKTAAKTVAKKTAAPRKRVAKKAAAKKSTN